MLQTLFKTPILVKDNVLSQDKLDILEQECIDVGKELKEYPDPYNPDIYKVSRAMPSYNCHTSPVFDEISGILLLNAKQMLDEMGYSTNQIDNLVPSRSWFSLYKNGDCLPIHIHRGSLIACAFYIRSESNTKLRFINDVYRNTTYPADLSNEWGRNSVDFECKTSRLVMFTSDSVHGHDKIYSDSTADVVKVMLSYNFKIG